VKYEPVAAKAIREPIYKVKVLDLNRFVREARIVEYGPVAAKAVREQIHKGKVLDF